MSNGYSELVAWTIRATTPHVTCCGVWKVGEEWCGMCHMFCFASSCRALPCVPFLFWHPALLCCASFRSVLLSFAFRCAALLSFTLLGLSGLALLRCSLLCFVFYFRLLYFAVCFVLLRGRHHKQGRRRFQANPVKTRCLSSLDPDPPLQLTSAKLLTESNQNRRRSVEPCGNKKHMYWIRASLIINPTSSAFYHYTSWLLCKATILWRTCMLILL